MIVLVFFAASLSKAIILIFLVNLPMVNIYKFTKKGILIQPPGEPREQHLDDVRPKKFELHKISYQLTKWLEGSIHNGAFFRDEKDLISNSGFKISQLETLKLLGCSLFFNRRKYIGSCYFNLNFFSVFSKMRQSISTLPITLSCEIFSSSNF